MAFPLTHRGKLEFPLEKDPDITCERFYEDASFKLERSFAIDANMEITTSDNKLIVSYTVKFKKTLILVSLLVSIGLGIYFATWDLMIPPDWPRTWGKRGVVASPPSVTQMLSAMGFLWIWLFGMNYLITVARLRSLLRDTWRELKLP
jgi:hypothetical protein